MSRSRYRDSLTPELKAEVIKKLEPINYMMVVNGIIESLELNEPSGFGAYEEELRQAIQEDIEYWNKVKQILESPKDISYYNSIAY